jgi:GxxExxY protein
MLHAELTSSVLGCFYRVFNELGHGFLERVYETALFMELHATGHAVERQRRLEVYYHGEQIRYYYADLVVDGSVIIEVKAASGIANEHEAQLINYLKASTIEVGILLNFGIKPTFRRLAFSNDRKELPSYPRQSAPRGGPRHPRPS